MLRAGLEPATCRLGVDNGTVPARSRTNVAVVDAVGYAESNRTAPNAPL